MARSILTLQQYKRICDINVFSLRCNLSYTYHSARCSKPQKRTFLTTTYLKKEASVKEPPKEKLQEKPDPPPKGIPYNKLTVGVPKETWKNEKRVALVPAAVEALIKKGFTVNVEENAGLEAKIRNADFEKSGAKIVNTESAFNSGMLTDFGE
nr:unnamed protein product [Callosobruchus chinensis]